MGGSESFTCHSDGERQTESPLGFLLCLCRHVCSICGCAVLEFPFFLLFPFKKDRQTKVSATVCITEVISSAGVHCQQSVLRPALTCHHMPSAAFNFSTSCFNVMLFLSMKQMQGQVENGQKEDSLELYQNCGFCWKFSGFFVCSEKWSTLRGIAAQNKSWSLLQSK